LERLEKQQVRVINGGWFNRGDKGGHGEQKSLPDPPTKIKEWNTLRDMDGRMNKREGVTAQRTGG